MHFWEWIKMLFGRSATSDRSQKRAARPTPDPQKRATNSDRPQKGAAKPTSHQPRTGPAKPTSGRPQKKAAKPTSGRQQKGAAKPTSHQPRTRPAKSTSGRPQKGGVKPTSDRPKKEIAQLTPGRPQTGTDEIKRLNATSETTLSNALKALAPGQRGWISFNDAARLFSPTGEHPSEWNPAGAAALVEFAARIEHRSAPERNEGQQRVYFTRIRTLIL
jgi:hypothetical protein